MNGYTMAGLVCIAIGADIYMTLAVHQDMPSIALPTILAFMAHTLYRGIK